MYIICAHTKTIDENKVCLLKITIFIIAFLVSWCLIHFNDLLVIVLGVLLFSLRVVVVVVVVSIVVYLFLGCYLTENEDCNKKLITQLWPIFPYRTRQGRPARKILVIVLVLNVIHNHLVQVSRLLTMSLYKVNYSKFTSTYLCCIINWKLLRLLT